MNSILHTAFEQWLDQQGFRNDKQTHNIGSTEDEQCVQEKEIKHITNESGKGSDRFDVDEYMVFGI